MRLARICPCPAGLPTPTPARPSALLKTFSQQTRLARVCPCPAGQQLQQNQTPHPTNHQAPLILHLLYLSPPSPRQLFQPISRQMRLVRICPEGHTSTSPNIYSYNSALSPHKKSAHPTNRPTSATPSACPARAKPLPLLHLKHLANKHALRVFAPQGNSSNKIRHAPTNHQAYPFYSPSQPDSSLPTNQPTSATPGACPARATHPHRPDKTSPCPFTQARRAPAATLSRP